MSDSDIPVPPQPVAAAPAPARRPRVPWDAYRRISAWMGLAAFVSVIVILATVGTQLGGTAGEGQSPTTTLTIVILLSAPAVLAGLVSGSRFYALYAGYSRRLDPTALLSAADVARGNSVNSGFIGDGLWGSLIAGIATAVPGTIAFAVFLGPVAVIGLPVLALVGAIAWFTGWVIGAVAGMLISAAIGIAVGAASNPRSRNRLPWFLVAAFLPSMLVSVSLGAAVRFPDDRLNVLGGLLYILFGVPTSGEFLFGDVLLVVVRVCAWLASALFVCLVIVGTPAFLNRRLGIPEPAVEATEADDAVPPVPRAPQVPPVPPVPRAPEG